MALLVAALLFARAAGANPPAAKYIFPAGGQRGTTVQVRVGGCFFHGDAAFEMLGPGITAPHRIHEMPTVWFQGPLIPQPASQQPEDYPRDYAASIKINADAGTGPRAWRAWTSQGATAAMKFIVGDLPEVIEHEVDGAPTPVHVTLPVTINGRIFPRENVDLWTFHADAGQKITCDVNARRLGSPLDAELLILDPAGKPVPTHLLHVDGDPRLHFTAPVAGDYQVSIHDVAYGGLQNYVYRLTITAGPYVDSVYPLGGRRGTKVHFELHGQALAAGLADVELPATPENSARIEFRQADQKTNPIAIELGDLPEILEAEPNDHPSDVKPVPIPAMLNGRIDHPGDVDYWAVEAKKNDVLEIELRASRLGSPLDSVLTIEDSQAKQLARNDDIAPGQPDSQLTFKAPADGVYYIRVEDRFPSRGGKNFSYRLRVAPSLPDFRLTVVGDVVTLPRSSETPAEPPEKKRRSAPLALRVELQRLGGFDGPVNLSIDNLPPGVTASNTTIAARQTTAQIKLAAEPTTKIAAVHVRLHGSATIAGKTVDHGADIVPAPSPIRDQPVVVAPVDDILLAVAIPTPFRYIGEYEHPFIPCGSTHHRHYELDRGGFTGPITISLADRQIRHLQGVTGPMMVIPPGADSFDYWIALAPEMELGRTVRVQIMLTGVVTDFDGSKHVVTYSASEPSDQFVSVATAPLLTLRLENTSLLAQPGSTQDAVVKIQRAGPLAGQPVKLDLLIPPQLRDVSADPVLLTPDQSDCIFHVRFGARPGPFTLPVILHATAPGPQDPSVAETKIDLVAAPAKQK